MSSSAIMRVMSTAPAYGGPNPIAPKSQLGFKLQRLKRPILKNKIKAQRKGNRNVSSKNNQSSPLVAL